MGDSFNVKETGPNAAICGSDKAVGSIEFRKVFSSEAGSDEDYLKKVRLLWNYRNEDLVVYRNGQMIEEIEEFAESKRKGDFPEENWITFENNKRALDEFVLAATTMENRVEEIALRMLFNCKNDKMKALYFISEGFIPYVFEEEVRIKKEIELLKKKLHFSFENNYLNEVG